MSSPPLAEPASVDPAKPIDTHPCYFWCWVEAVRRYWDSKRGSDTPLNARVDFYPIIFRYYKPRVDTKKPNPSVYLSYMKKAGMIRRFGADAGDSGRGRDTFYVPETEITLRVGGKVVYTPRDLDALLEGDERFQPPSEVVEPASEGEPPDADAGDDGGGAADEADPPAAEPAVKEKKRRNRQRSPEQNALVGKLVKVLWAAAEPTDDPAWRVIAKSAARDHAVRECGHVLHYTTLFRLGFLKSGADHETCLITDPNAGFREALAAPKRGQNPEQPAETSVCGSSSLSIEQISARITEREASFSTQELEDERAVVLRDVTAKRAELAAIDETRLRLREELRGLETSSEALAAQIETRMMQRQQDPLLLDLNWARDNFERLQRVLADSVPKS